MGQEIEKILQFYNQENLSNDITVVILNYIFCVLCSFALKIIYENKSTSLSGKFHIGIVIPILTQITFFIILIVKSSLALSLGLIGALSIVRFRTPVKNPFELVTYFVLITIGIVVNVNPSLALNFVFFLTLLAVIYFLLNMSSFNLNTIDFHTDEYFVLSTETTKKIDNEGDNLSLIHFSQNNDKFVYVFKSKNLNDINEFISSISKDILTSYSIDK